MITNSVLVHTLISRLKGIKGSHRIADLERGRIGQELKELLDAKQNIKINKRDFKNLLVVLDKISSDDFRQLHASVIGAAIRSNPALFSLLLKKSGLLEVMDSDVFGGKENECSFFGKREEVVLERGSLELMRILRSPKSLKSLLFILSIVRLGYPCVSTKDRGGLPFREALGEKIYFRLFGNIYISPCTQSFRRHFIFKMNSHGDVPLVVEIFIPGQEDERIKIEKKRFQIAKDMQSLGYGSLFVAPLLMVTCREKMEFDIYGRLVGFNGLWNNPPLDNKFPLRIFIFSYCDGNRLNYVSEAYIEILAKRFTTTAEAIISYIARRTLEIFFSWRSAGWHWGQDGHIGNLRLIEGKSGIDTFGGFLLQQVQDTSPKDTEQSRSETPPFRAKKKRRLQYQS
jgi:hypothetical protein